MKTLFLFIPHYVYTSDLLKTGYIRYAAEKYKVIVFSPAFRNTPPSNYFQHKNVEYHDWEILRPLFWIRATKMLRIPLMREFDHLHYYVERKTYAYVGWKRKLLRFVSHFFPKNFFSADRFTRWESRFYPRSPEFESLIKKYKPALIITATPGFSDVEAEVIILARKSKIPSVSINFSWDNLTTNAVQIRKPDYLACWNKIVKEEAMNLHHYPEDRLFVSGIMRFDHHFTNKDSAVSREEFLKSKGLDTDRKTLLFTTVPQHTYPHQVADLRSIKKFIDADRFNKKVNVFVRLHPREDMETYKEFLDLPNFHFELAGSRKRPSKSQPHKIELSEHDYENLRNTLRYADVNINYCSSISLEAAIYQKPIVNLALHGYTSNYKRDHYAPIVASKGVRLAKNEEELLEAINLYLKHPEADAEGRQKIFDDFIMFKDGMSYRRNVDALSEILNRT